MVQSTTPANVQHIAKSVTEVGRQTISEVCVDQLVNKEADSSKLCTGSQMQFNISFPELQRDAYSEDEWPEADEDDTRSFDLVNIKYLGINSARSVIMRLETSS